MVDNNSPEGERLHVTPKGDEWQVKPEGQPATSSHPTQAQAEQAAKDQLRHQPGGGEVIIHRPDGTIRDGDTINRQDPNPPKDTKH